MQIRMIALSILFFCLVGCEGIALLSTPSKKPRSSQSQLNTMAQHAFWQALHQGKYEAIPQVDKLLMAAYLENPNDPILASHLGFLHIWKIAERHRLPTNSPLMPNEIILSNKYFADAILLNPHDPRTVGFFGDTQLIMGQIFKDQREQVRGYFTLKRAIYQWPQFNYFTAGYPMSSLPKEDKFFKQGLEWQWKTLDVCAQTKVDRFNPDFGPFMELETQRGPERACWNSWIAPYNFEGFFMNMGDMLVKSGDWRTAIIIYENAKLDKDYNAWPFRSLLEKRIQHAQENVVNFQQDLNDDDKRIMFNSRFSCMACHQIRKS